MEVFEKTTNISRANISEQLQNTSQNPSSLSQQVPYSERNVAQFSSSTQQPKKNNCKYILFIAGPAYLLVFVVSLISLIQKENELLKREEDFKNKAMLELLEYKNKLNSTTLEGLVFLPKYKKFNYNIAHYLLEKQKITAIQCINCPEGVIDQYKQKPFYELLSINQASLDMQNEWIYSCQTPYFTSKEDIDIFLVKIGEGSSQKLKGFSLFWNSTSNHNSTVSLLKDYLFQKISESNFYYNEAVSLNLRFMEKGIVMIFEKTKPIYKPLPFFDQNLSNKTIGFQSVFRMDQNIPFLREWLLYHIKLGITKYFLYDNDGTYGLYDVYNPKNNATAERNKYSVDLQCIGTEQKKFQMFDQIWEDFEEYIIYIPWQPVQGNKIVYAQIQATANYLQYYEDVTKWTVYTDLDEFIMSQKDYNLIQYVNNKQKEGTTSLVLRHKKFQSRFCLEKKLAIEGYLSLDIQDLRWAPKMIALNTVSRKFSVHDMEMAFGRKQVIPNDVFRFNHYNLVEMVIWWGYEHGFGRADETHIDTFMQRYVPLLKTYCKGKCSDTYQMKCPPQKIHLDTKCAQLKRYQ